MEIPRFFPQNLSRILQTYLASKIFSNDFHDFFKIPGFFQVFHDAHLYPDFKSFSRFFQFVATLRESLGVAQLKEDMVGSSKVMSLYNLFVMTCPFFNIIIPVEDL